MQSCLACLRAPGDGALTHDNMILRPQQNLYALTAIFHFPFPIPHFPFPAFVRHDTPDWKEHLMRPLQPDAIAFHDEGLDEVPFQRPFNIRQVSAMAVPRQGCPLLYDSILSKIAGFTNTDNRNKRKVQACFVSSALLPLLLPTL